MSSYEFYKSEGFYLVASTAFFFGFSLLVVLKLAPNYCIMDKIKPAASMSMVKSFAIALMVMVIVVGKREVLRGLICILEEI